jgi:hypothetical protein
MEANRAMGVTLVDLGRCTEALEHLNQACDLYKTNRNHRYTVFIGLDCKVISDCFAARALWALGHPNEASERMRTGLGLARELAHPQTLVAAEHLAARLDQLEGEASVCARTGQKSSLWRTNLAWICGRHSATLI